MASEARLRIVGKRVPASSTVAPRQPPSAEARAAMTGMAQYRTRVPKGIFVYASHDEANRDWDEWRVAAMLANTRAPR